MFGSMANMLGAVSAEFANFVSYTKIVLIALIAVCAIAIIVLVLCQKGNSGGFNALSGTTETYYAQNKGKTLEGRLKKWTIALGILIAAFTIIYFILWSIVQADI